MERRERINQERFFCSVLECFVNTSLNLFTTHTHLVNVNSVYKCKQWNDIFPFVHNVNIKQTQNSVSLCIPLVLWNLLNDDTQQRQRQWQIEKSFYVTKENDVKSVRCGVFFFTISSAFKNTILNITAKSTHYLKVTYLLINSVRCSIAHVL